MKASDVTVAVPTYGRDRVLVETVERVLELDPAPGGVLVVDQTPAHAEEAGRRLSSWDRAGLIRWLRPPEPSIPRAMNLALREAGTPVVLFLDDDVVPSRGLAAAHAAAYDDPSVRAVTGQVLQPGEAPEPARYRGVEEGLGAFLDFPFHSTIPHEVGSVMAGNLSVRREPVLEIGGFDEKFVGVAYRFETELARRIRSAGGRVLFRPEASVRHLRVEHGGTRTRGSHLTSASPLHGVGDYYYALRCGSGLDRLRYIARRPLREVATRFHLRRPWWIPVKLIGEARALWMAIRLAGGGPRWAETTAPELVR